MEILQDLCIRLGQEWQPQLLDMLAKFSGGNVRHLECLLAAAASLCLHTTALTKEHVQLAGLRKVFSPDFQFTSAIWERVSGGQAAEWFVQFLQGLGIRQEGAFGIRGRPPWACLHCTVLLQLCN